MDEKQPALYLTTSIPDFRHSMSSAILFSKIGTASLGEKVVKTRPIRPANWVQLNFERDLPIAIFPHKLMRPSNGSAAFAISALYFHVVSNLLLMSFILSFFILTENNKIIHFLLQVLNYLLPLSQYI